MFATALIDEKLIRLFQRHFADPVAALLRLERHLAQIPLSFDLKAQIREVTFPPMPDLPQGQKSFVYYFLPCSGWGSDKVMPADPLAPDFVTVTDGVSLNLGCPVRLLRALDILASIQPNDRKEIKEGLLNPYQHFATIEELLWTSVWKSPSDLSRGGTLPGAKGNVDWRLKSQGFPLFLEAKFRPSDWPRLTDKGTFEPMTGSFLGKALHKFPDPPHEAALYVVGITTYDNLTEAVKNQIGQELEKLPQIHCVIFRALTHMTHVLSIYLDIRDRIFSLLATPKAREYPTNYAVLSHIQQRDKRVAERQKVGKSKKANSPVYCWGVRPDIDEPIPMLEDQYRMNVVSRGSDGEPKFEAVPKFLPKSS